MVGGPSIVLTRYHEVGKFKIRDNQCHNAKTCARAISFGANSLYLYCSDQEMPCGKEEYVEACPEIPSKESCEELCDQVLRGELFGFLQVDFHVPDELIDNFSEFCPLFIVDNIPNELIPLHIKEYQKRTGQKTIPLTQKLLGVMCAEKILLYMSLLKWYLSHGLKVTVVHKYLKYESGKTQWRQRSVIEAARRHP